MDVVAAKGGQGSVLTVDLLLQMEDSFPELVALGVDCALPGVSAMELRPQTIERDEERLGERPGARRAAAEQELMARVRCQSLEVPAQRHLFGPRNEKRDPREGRFRDRLRAGERLSQEPSQILQSRLPGTAWHPDHA